MPNYNMSEREAAAVIALGTKVERSTANMTDGLSLFDIEGGKCLLTLVVGEVTSALQGATRNYRLRSNPDTGTTTNLCADLDINADQIGTLYTLEGTYNVALQRGKSGSVPGPTFPLIVPPGAIEMVVDSTTSGEVEWTLWYIPLEVGAYIEAT